MDKTTQMGELTAGEIEKEVVRLAKEGVSPSKIGLILRDQYAIPDVKEATGKTLLKILDSHGVRPELPEDLANVIKKAVRLYAHLERNRKDFKSKRSLETIESRINRLSRYYKRKGLLPEDWRYDRERAAILVRS
jgi:small subunit ribosomal protein S15